MQRLRPFIEQCIDRRCDALTGDSFDFMAELAGPVPAEVIAHLFGIAPVSGASQGVAPRALHSPAHGAEHCRAHGTQHNAQPGAGHDTTDGTAHGTTQRITNGDVVGSGLRADGQSDFAAWSHALAAFIGAPQPAQALAAAARASLGEMTRFFAALLAKRRHEPGDDLVGLLIRAQAAGQIHGNAELLAQCAMLLFAGFETTRNLLGNGLRTLLADTDQWQRLRREPHLAAGTVREMLRYDSPVQYTARRVTTDLLLQGQQLRRGDMLVAFIGAANRDPARYDQPDQFDPTRRQGASLAFGAGPHACIGTALSVMEAEILFTRLSCRWPHLRLVASSAAWNQNPVYRGLTRLDVAV